MGESIQEPIFMDKGTVAESLKHLGPGGRNEYERGRNEVRLPEISPKRQFYSNDQTIETIDNDRQHQRYLSQMKPYK